MFSDGPEGRVLTFSDGPEGRVLTFSDGPEGRVFIAHPETGTRAVSTNRVPVSRSRRRRASFQKDNTPRPAYQPQAMCGTSPRHHEGPSQQNRQQRRHRHNGAPTPRKPGRSSRTRTIFSDGTERRVFTAHAAGWTSPTNCPAAPSPSRSKPSSAVSSIWCGRWPRDCALGRSYNATASCDGLEGPQPGIRTSHV